MITDIIITILILVSIVFAINVKDAKREDDEISEDDLTELAKRNDIDWSMLSYNPNVVKLLKKRFEYEKSLSDMEYKRLLSVHKIDWVIISANNEAIELIKERIEYEKSLGDNYEYQRSGSGNNPLNKINWENMFRNENAIELIREKIKYDTSFSGGRNALLNKNIMILMKEFYLSNK
jgi:hypothetical protein